VWATNAQWSFLDFFLSSQLTWTFLFYQ
jgi:hypothetical protein